MKTVLDLFCGAGGAAVGYARAGFRVIGVDKVEQKRYPFAFVKVDALEYVDEYGSQFDLIHASPPCKLATALNPFSGLWHEDLIPDTREALRETGRPYVIENVPGADLINPVVLCGSMFDLGVRRHRLFEVGFSIPIQPDCDHKGQAARSPGYAVADYHSGKRVDRISPVIGVYGRGQGLGRGETDLWRQAMGIPWMTKDELSQAVPPAYTEWIGERFNEFQV